MRITDRIIEKVEAFKTLTGQEPNCIFLGIREYTDLTTWAYNNGCDICGLEGFEGYDMLLVKEPYCIGLGFVDKRKEQMADEEEE